MLVWARLDAMTYPRYHIFWSGSNMTVRIWLAFYSDIIICDRYASQSSCYGAKCADGTPCCIYACSYTSSVFWGASSCIYLSIYMTRSLLYYHIGLLLTMQNTTQYLIVYVYIEYHEIGMLSYFYKKSIILCGYFTNNYY